MYSRKDNADKQREHALLLKHMDLSKVVFLKRRSTSRGSVYGSFFVLNELGQCIDITYSIAILLDKEMTYIDNKARAIDVTHVETVVRDLSEFLYGHWDKITLYILE